MRTMAYPLFRRLAALALAGAAMAADAIAQPASPLPPGNVTVVVPFTPGGPLDVVARLFADKVGSKYARTIVVENKAGAAGNVGGMQVARAEPNGLTWVVMVDSMWTVNPHMQAGQGFDASRDLLPVGQLGQVVLMLAVHPKVPAKTWGELLAHSKQKSLNFGSAGVGSPGHLALEYLKMASPLDAAHVPFRGASQAITELLGGNVDAAFIVAGVMLDHVRAGTVRPLAVSDAKRLASFPDVPTADEVGIKGFEARFSNIVALPLKTPPAIADFLRAEMAAFAALPDVKTRFAAIGTEFLLTGEDETRKWIAQERERWGKVITARGIKPDSAKK